MSKSYTNNLTQEQWELIEPLIPLAKKVVETAGQTHLKYKTL